MWADLNHERNDPNSARFRRIEALLGYDPDIMAGERIESWLLDAASLGENALAELATGSMAGMMSARQINDVSMSKGFQLEPDDGFRFDHPFMVKEGDTEACWGDIAAWRIGVAAANTVSQQADLAEEPISDAILAELAGTSKTVIQPGNRTNSTNSVSWMFESKHGSTQIALRPWIHTARRFDLARLVGDRLFRESGFTADEPLSPATSSYSYRQKAQRAFAAELLSPWETVQAMLEDDYSQENREQVAERFGVSPLTIENLVRSNGGISRQQANEDGFN